MKLKISRVLYVVCKSLRFVLESKLKVSLKSSEINNPKGSFKHRQEATSLKKRMSQLGKNL